MPRKAVPAIARLSEADKSHHHLSNVFRGCRAVSRTSFFFFAGKNNALARQRAVGLNGLPACFAGRFAASPHLRRAPFAERRLISTPAFRDVSPSHSTRNGRVGARPLAVQKKNVHIWFRPGPPGKPRRPPRARSGASFRRPSPNVVSDARLIALGRRDCPGTPVPR